MRSWATWLLVGGLAALGAVAPADALRGSPKTGEPHATRQPIVARDLAWR
jgi:hypothetical protein